MALISLLSSGSMASGFTSGLVLLLDGGTFDLLWNDERPAPRCDTLVWQVSFFPTHRPHGI